MSVRFQAFAVLRVLALALAGVFLSRGAAAMEFFALPLGPQCTIEFCPRVFVAEGEIESDTPDRFERFLEDQLRIPGVRGALFMNSAGGNVESALRLGSILHDEGLAVVIGWPLPETPRSQRRKSTGALRVVPGHCASACVYTLMGAKRRIVPKGARLGVHRMSAKVAMFNPFGPAREERIFAGPEEIATLRSYVADVGGSQALVTLAESVPHDRIRMLSAREIRTFQLGVAQF